jgi:Spy/CpxP family protein refolding chaperone
MYCKKTNKKIKGSVMKQLMIAVMLSIGIGSVAMSMGGDHGQRLDWDQLDLTEQQTQQVEIIRKTYRDDFQRLRQQEIDKLDKKRQMLSLRDIMVANIHQVLSAEQRQQARTMMAEQAEKRINKRLDRLARNLALTSKQQHAMHTLVSTNLVQYSKAFLAVNLSGINNRQSMFDQVDEFMPSILSSLQLKQWQKIKDKRIKYLAS